MFQDRLLNYSLVVFFCLPYNFACFYFEISCKTYSQIFLTPIELITIEEVASLKQISPPKITSTEKFPPSFSDSQKFLNLNEDNQTAYFFSEKDLPIILCTKNRRKTD